MPPDETQRLINRNVWTLPASIKKSVGSAIDRRCLACERCAWATCPAKRRMTWGLWRRLVSPASRLGASGFRATGSLALNTGPVRCRAAHETLSRKSRGSRAILPIRSATRPGGGQTRAAARPLPRCFLCQSITREHLEPRRMVCNLSVTLCPCDTTQGYLGVILRKAGIVAELRDLSLGTQRGTRTRSERESPGSCRCGVGPYRRIRSCPSRRQRHTR